MRNCYIKIRKHKPIFMVDIAVPRDIEIGVGELDDVYLYSVDDLKDIVQVNLKKGGYVTLFLLSLWTGTVAVMVSNIATMATTARV